MSKINIFDTIREKHQTAARLLASGRSTSDVARLTGASEAQLIRQCLDPTFRDLVSRYRLSEVSETAESRFRAYSIAA